MEQSTRRAPFLRFCVSCNNAYIFIVCSTYALGSLLYGHRRLRQHPQQPFLSSVPPGMPHRQTSAHLLSSNLESSTPSSKDAVYTSCLQALPLAARTSRLPSVARAHQQRPGQECDPNAEGAVVRPSWRARRETAARGSHLRARRCPIQLWRSVVGSARGASRGLVGGMRQYARHSKAAMNLQNQRSKLARYVVRRMAFDCN